jgi:hypothetical protein
MRTIHRYQKDTIRNQAWETSITIDGDTITMDKIHFRKDNYDVIKEVSETITPKEMETFMRKNQMYHIETYKD